MKQITEYLENTLVVFMILTDDFGDKISLILVVGKAFSLISFLICLKPKIVVLLTCKNIKLIRRVT